MGNMVLGEEESHCMTESKIRIVGKKEVQTFTQHSL